MKKILIIDDNETFATTLTDMISETYEVIAAGDGEEGLAKFESEKPDLVVLDLMMPKVGGIEFLKTLRDQKPGDPTPVIIASNIDTMESIGEGVKLGVCGYVTKSEDSLEDIITTIRRALGDA